MRTLEASFSLTVAVLSILLGVAVWKPTLWAGPSPDRQQLLSKLVEGAKKERELVIWGGIPELGENGAREYGETFKARFGLKDIRFKYDTAGVTGEKFSHAVMETKLGLPASYDVMYGPDHRVIALIGQGGVEAIDNWRILLPDGADQRFVSPSVVEGKAFLFATRANGIIYNSKLMPASDVPRTTGDVADPKYKGKFYTAPWTTYVNYGILVYPKQQWLETMKGWGRNKELTVVSAGGIVRMMAGEFSFEPFSNTYYYFHFRSKGDPVGVAFFTDVVPLSLQFYVVRRNARNPNVAKLFALWAAGSEAVQIFEKYSWTPNMYVKASRIGQEEAALIDKLGAKVVTWFDSNETLDKLMWYTTKEGREYEAEIAKALKLK